MNVSIDISMYPLNPDYKPSIQAFIDGLNAYSEITTQENNMSTQVFGEYRTAMKIVQDEIEKASGDEPKVVFVMKLIPFDLS
ncbi:MAG: hypothetical protein ACPGRC_06245 [Salibacteraceae bacterium]